MLICNRCGQVLSEDELEYERVCWEEYYGVGSMFPNKNYGDIKVCPVCGSDNLDEYFEEDEEDEEEAEL